MIECGEEGFPFMPSLKARKERTLEEEERNLRWKEKRKLEETNKDKKERDDEALNRYKRIT